MRSLLIIIFLFSITTTKAQQRCHTIWHGEESVSKKQSAGQPVNGLITIPVVVHILYNDNKDNISRERVLSQLEVLNKDFAGTNDDIGNVPTAFKPFIADTRIRFALATVDPEGRATDGIVRKQTMQQSWNQDDRMKFSENGGSDAWNSHHYLNIWVCRLGNSMLGYASFPGSAPEKDGVVIRTDIFGTLHVTHPVYNKGRTATHEIGHWLNLKHLWGDQFCGDDGVDDTPPQSNYNSGCSNFPVIKYACNDDPKGEMFMNFMDFSDDACALMFTKGQASRMQQLFEAGGLRTSILQSPAFGEPWNLTPSPDDNLVLHLYPNPATTEILLSDKRGTRLMVDEYAVYSVSGQKILQGRAQSVVPLHTIQKGVYFIQVSTNRGMLSGRFVKH